MARLSFVVPLTLLSLVLSLVNARNYPTANYWLVKDFQAGTANFFDNFNFYTGADPTHGDVNYLDAYTAESDWQAYSDGTTSWMGVDYWSYSSPRNSVRIESIETFNNVLVIAEFDYVPGSTCSTWPAFWMANLYSWPYGGEIDILEGVNNQYYNHYAFHVGGTCKQKGQSQTGIVETSNCNVYAPGQSSNAGCGGWATSAETYGDWMNYAGGGVYAMDWRTAGIRIWYFSPDNIPSDIQNGNPTTSGWGTPMADLPSTGCNIGNNFYDHSIIFDIDLCGDWAGSVYNSSGCPGTCTDYVYNNPGAFLYSWFGITGLKVYQSSIS